ncbi:polyribonucleotide nucleotidyltransferase [Parvularcula sp. ZS-1/3]|uniref:Polyribonucleotide nucleotidyltransferase n=1 Tax=Parvularcula mediterranea TaxID=2732508 RepID=A0A7Y3RJX0_9PROT|nr:polyribonucleotide nucleotidyltransferase [Parvularcula mediterranea]NNU15391.1 polyribonucleotide nucleotidyltransferase [Parvularcula mediterranea]
MFQITRKTMTWAGRELTLETGRIARQADGAVLATYGETTVLATVVGKREQKPGQDFFPLTVNYQEKGYAAGRIPGGFFKREGRPTEKETLTSRLIDRPIRPLFAPGFKNEVQVVLTVMSHDLENDPDIVAMVGASAALTISGVPFMGPIGAARVGYKDGNYIVNPPLPEMEGTELDLVMAGTADAVMMVESEASELSEDVMLGAVMEGHKASKEVVDFIISFAEQCAKEPWDFQAPDYSDLMPRVRAEAEAGLRDAYALTDKTERVAKLNEVKSAAKEKLAGEDASDPIDGAVLGGLLKELESDIVRTQVIETGGRIDGRTTTDIRPIVAEAGILPRSHGSSLFTRGETQSIVVATLGTSDDEQFIDALEGTYKENFLLHYNFPPYSVGETGRMGSPGRREIGHGKLAWRAVRAVLPSQEEFPYVIRLVSEITESNGSSSMATVCGSSLAMMDAGVPIKRAVAGIAMGLILEGDKHAVLSDILGDEDHLGDMDFKVAGTSEGVTSLQMDIKVAGITEDIMKTALGQAKDGRMHILGEMNKALTESRDDLGDYAPRIETMTIPKEKIREVIGSGGKVIREIVETTGAKVNIDDEGVIKIASSDKSEIEAAVKWIKSITDEPEVGEIYQGKVVKTMDFGAFVNFFGARDGLVHISQLAANRVEKTTDVVKEGDQVWVKLLGFDDRGKTKLSMKVVDQETGKEIEKEKKDD